MEASVLLHRLFVSECRQGRSKSKNSACGCTIKALLLFNLCHAHSISEKERGFGCAVAATILAFLTLSPSMNTPLLGFCNKCKFNGEYHNFLGYPW